MNNGSLIKGNNLGERVRNRRKALGWTLDVLAVRTGLSKTFLSQIENQKSRPGAETVASLARAFGTTMDTLMACPSINVRTTTGDLIVPEGLRSLAQREELPLGVVTLLITLHGVLVIYRRTAPRHPFDWVKFYEAIKEFL